MLPDNQKRLLNIALSVVLLGILNIILALLLKYTLTSNEQIFKAVETVYGYVHLVNGCLILVFLIIHENVGANELFSTKFSKKVRFILGSIIVTAAALSLGTFTTMQVDQVTLLWPSFAQVGWALLYILVVMAF